MNKLHYIHSRAGRIGGRADTSPGDVDAIVNALRDDPRKHLVLHFHGGLVSKDAGLDIAEKLLDVYSPSAATGGYPVFFVWEAGAWETIRNNLTELAGEPVFKQLLRKLLQYALEKLGGLETGGAGRSFAQAGVGSLAREADAELTAFWSAPDRTTLPFRGLGIAARTGAARSAAVAISEDEIRADLERDADFLSALATLPDISAATRSSFAKGAVREHRSAFSEMASATFSEGADTKGLAGTRGLIDLYVVAKYLARVLIAVISRHMSGRDHGRYATCVEELVRGFKVAGSGAHEWAKALEWNRMKQDTADAFGPDPDLHAGTALLSRLQAAFASGLSLNRITLVGHSTGSIYIAHWLENCCRYLPETLKHDVVFLAPAITCDDFARVLDNHAAQIGNFRMFAMKDKFERDDQVWGQDADLPKGSDWRRFLYPSSLLYLVSGILESRPSLGGGMVDEADVPLLGMERFYADTETYPDDKPDFLAIRKIREWMNARPNSVVWSTQTGQPSGLNSESTDHGGFDDDPATLQSLRHIVEGGILMAARDDHYAVLVAITRYPGLSDLEGPENDAEDFRQWLLDPAGGALDPSRVAVIRSSDFPPAAIPDDACPTEREFKKVLNRWCRRPDGLWREAPVGERLYLFFAGHGFTAGSGDNPALFTAQAQFGDASHIAGLKYAENIQIAGLFREIVLIMDCCQTVMMTASVNVPTWAPTDRNATNSVVMMKAFAAPRGKAARESTGKPGPVRGYFSSVFFNALRNAPADDDGYVTAEAVEHATLDAWKSGGYDGLTGIKNPPINGPRDLLLYRRGTPCAAIDLTGIARGGANASAEDRFKQVYSILGSRDVDGILSSRTGQSALAGVTAQSEDECARVRILDAEGREVASGGSPLHVELRPGAYIARFRLGDAVEDRPFEVENNCKPVVVNVGPLEFSSPVPMPHTSTTRAPHYAAAVELAETAVARASKSRAPDTVGTVMVFARDSCHVPGTKWLMPETMRTGLRLRALDVETGRPGLVPSEPFVDASLGYSSLLLTGLSPGTYLLGVRRVLREHVFWQETALTVAALGWRTEVYLDSVNDDWCGRCFDAASASVLTNLSKSGATISWLSTRYDEIARLFLAEGRRGVDESSLAHMIRYSGALDPILMLYTAYALTLAPVPDVSKIRELCERLNRLWTSRSADVKLLERWCSMKDPGSEPSTAAAFLPSEVPMIARGWKLSRQLGQEGRLAPGAQQYIGAWRTSGSLWTQTQVPEGIDTGQIAATRSASVTDGDDDLSTFAKNLVRPSVQLSPLQQSLRSAILGSAEPGERTTLHEFVKHFADKTGFDRDIIFTALAGLDVRLNT